MSPVLWLPAVAPAGLWGGRLAASGPLWEPSPLPGPAPSKREGEKDIQTCQRLGLKTNTDYKQSYCCLVLCRCMTTYVVGLRGQEGRASPPHTQAATRACTRAHTGAHAPPPAPRGLVSPGSVESEVTQLCPAPSRELSAEENPPDGRPHRLPLEECQQHTWLPSPHWTCPM